MESFLGPGALWIKLLHATLDPETGQYCWSAMPGSNDIDHLDIVFPDQIVDVRVHQDQTWTCPPVS